MKTLVWNGSPHKNGATAGLIAAFCDAMPGECAVIDCYEADAAPCIDCRYCWEHAGCRMDDGMREIYRRIDEADNIVIASPIYFAELTGSLLRAASRLQCLWAAQRFRGAPLLQPKRRLGAALLSAGGEGPCEQPLAMAKRLLRIMGASYAGHVCDLGTDPGARRDEQRALAAARALAARLAEEQKREAGPGQR